ncbi:MAG: class I SAM-dependent methyltransferase [bacterium]|nr:class I SAM-dependent methyltransferase [bacterium]
METGIVETVRDYVEGVLKDVYFGDIEKIVLDTLSERRVGEQLELLSSFVGDLKGKSLLEVGSGWGLFVALARKQQVDSYGIEPEEDVYQASLKVLGSYGLSQDILKQAPGEKIPFEDNTFDVVYSTMVLEHVEDPEKVIKESIRVLKKGGYLQFVIPNYGSFWEGHYGILWPPNLSKPLAKIYVSLLGRNPSYLDGLNFINQGYLKKIIANIDEVKVINWGYETWRKRLLSLQFSGWATLGSLRRLVKLAHRLHLVRLICLFGKWFNWHTPIIMTMQKR